LAEGGLAEDFDLAWLDVPFEEDDVDPSDERLTAMTHTIAGAVNRVN
jgi:hypothetical protein